MGTYLIVTLGAPQKDDDGVDIRDQFSDYPTFQAYLYRTWRELEYYRKVCTTHTLQPFQTCLQSSPIF